MNATPGTDVTLMAKTEGKQAAYGVKCPKCKALPGRFCVVLTPKNVGPYTPPNPKWGSPCKTPHNERFEKVREVARKAAYERWMAERGTPLKDLVAEDRQAMAQQNVREFAQMKAWLKEHGRVLWTTR